MLLATAQFVITTIVIKFKYFLVSFFPKVPRTIQLASFSLLLETMKPEQTQDTASLLRLT